MAEPGFQHLGVEMVKDVAVVEIRTRDLQGPKLAQELGGELELVTAQDWAKKVVVNLHKVEFLSSTGFAVLFKLALKAKNEGRRVVICGMAPAVKVGADIVGLAQVAEVCDSESAAIHALGTS